MCRTLARSLSLAVALGGAGACIAEPPPAAAEVPRVEVLAVVDPDLTNPLAPQPGLVVWLSTRVGTARFLSDGREVSDERVPVAGGEVASTELPPTRLVPGINDVQLYFVPAAAGSSVLTERFNVLVDAECTWHDHCPEGSCDAFACSEP